MILVGSPNFKRVDNLIKRQEPSYAPDLGEIVTLANVIRIILVIKNDETRTLDKDKMIDL